MSEQRISQRSSSDFSIARILSKDLSPNLKTKFRVSEVFSNNGDKFGENSIEVLKEESIEALKEESIEALKEESIEVLKEAGIEGRKNGRETLEGKREDDEFKKIERLQPVSVNLNSEDLEDWKEYEEDRRSEILGRELPWLRCTRYSPPKLPRRPSSGKQTKRRLGSHPRIPFTKLQIQVLEEKYRISAYLSRRDVIQLAGTLNLPQNRVKIWFQNRRARERRESQSHNLNS